MTQGKLAKPTKAFAVHVFTATCPEAFSKNVPHPVLAPAPAAAADSRTTTSAPGKGTFSRYVRALTTVPVSTSTTYSPRHSKTDMNNDNHNTTLRKLN